MCISIRECPGTAILEETSSSAHSQGYVGDSTVITSTAAKNKIFRKRSRSWSSFEQNRVLCLVAQSYPTLCDPMDCSPPGSSVHGDSPGKNTGVGCHAFLQGIFPTPGSNSGLPHCRQILYHLSHKGVESPLNYVAVVFLENSGHMKTI